jgi:hypothetical protein
MAISWNGVRVRITNGARLMEERLPTFDQHFLAVGMLQDRSVKEFQSLSRYNSIYQAVTPERARYY